MLMQNIEGLENERLAPLEELKQKSLPIVMYGSGFSAPYVERFLNENGLSVSARFVDKNYKSPAGTLSFEDVEKNFEKFCVVGAMSDLTKFFQAMKQHSSKKIAGVYWFMVNPLYMDAVNHSFVRENASKLEGVYNMLSDRQSREAYLGYISAQVSGNQQFLIDQFCSNQYFPDCIKLSDKEVFVDVGAYIGDTLADFLRNAGDKYNKYYAFEPNTINFEVLKRFVEAEGLEKVQPINCGLGAAREIARFDQDGGISYASRVCKTGNASIQIDTIDRLCPDASFIKMDIEGGELEALQGAENTIRSNRPKLAISAYHKPSHLWELANYVKSLVPEYQIFFRQHQTCSCDFVMYAV